MRIKRLRYIILVIVFLFAVAGFLIYSFYTRNISGFKADFVNSNNIKVPVLYNVFGDYSINKMTGYSNEMDTMVSDNVTALVLEDLSINFKIADADISKIDEYDYNVRKFDTGELIEDSDRIKVESENMNIGLSSLIAENTEYLMEIRLYTEGNVFHYYTGLIRSDANFAKNLIDTAYTFSNNNFDEASARANTVYLESDGTGNSRGLEYVTLKSDFNMLIYNGMSLTHDEKEITLVNYNGKVGEVHLSFQAHMDDKTYRIEENFVCKSGAQRLYMLDYTRTMNEEILDNPGYSEKINLGIGNRRVKTVTDDKAEQVAFLADNKLFFADNKNKRLDMIYKAGSNEYIMPLTLGNGLYFITYGYSTGNMHVGDVGVKLLRYVPRDRALDELAFIKLDTDVGSLKNSVEEIAYIGENGILYLKLLDKVVGLDINSGSYITVAENLVQGKYSISEDKSLLSWNIGEGLNVYNFATGESKQLTNADEVLLPIGYIGSDLVVAIEAQNISNTINGKSTGGIFEKLSIYNNLLELQKDYTYDGRYIDDIAVDGNRVHINLYRYEGENFSRIGEDTIISSKSVNKESRVSFYNDDYRSRNYALDITKKINDEILFVKGLNIEGEDTEYNIDINTEYLKNMYHVYINSYLSGTYDNPTIAIEAAYEDMGFVRRNGITVYARAMVENSATAGFDAAESGEYLRGRENNELTRFQGITLKEAMYFINVNKPVFTFTAVNNPVIIFSYDRKNITFFDINSANVQKIDLNEAQNIFNSTQNDFSCFFTFAM